MENASPASSVGVNSGHLNLKMSWISKSNHTDFPKMHQNATSQEQSHPDQSPPLLVALGVFPVPPVSVSWGDHRHWRRPSRGTWTHPSRRGLVVAAPGWLVAPDQFDQAAFGSSLVRNDGSREPSAVAKKKVASYYPKDPGSPCQMMIGV